MNDIDVLVINNSILKAADDEKRNSYAYKSIYVHIYVYVYKYISR